MADRGNRGEMRQTAGQQAQTEFDARNGVLLNNLRPITASRISGLAGPLSAADVRGVPMTPLWVGDNLILARRVSAAGQRIWSRAVSWTGRTFASCSTDAVGDLLPDATFEPVPRNAAVDPSRMLAALPLRIVPGEFPADAAAGLSPLLLSLAVAWACLVATAVAVACLLAGIIRLSNRRASFVTAVTHELRTPLTTFQMYVEMLAEGMVPDVEQSRHYLKTLQAESARLTHMVENVLAYARLERGRTDGHVESIGLGELLDRVQDRLVQRAEPAGMEIVVAGEPSARRAVRRGQRLGRRTDPLQPGRQRLQVCVGRGRQADPRRVAVAGSRRGEIRVRDHGPGLPPSRRKGWFRSFSKSAQEAAHSAPGIGLGLALSRRLARHMGGDLRLEPGEGGGLLRAHAEVRCRYRFRVNATAAPVAAERCFATKRDEPLVPFSRPLAASPGPEGRAMLPKVARISGSPM